MDEITLPFEPQPIKPRRGFSLGSILLLGIILMIAAFFGVALVRQHQGQPEAGPAPDFAFTTFDGETLNLSDLQGQIVVLNFWASWCEPCETEAPELENFWRTYRDQGVVVLGITWSDTPSNTRKFIEKYDITYLNAPDLGTRITGLYNIYNIPETFVINREGEVIRFIKGATTEAELLSIIGPLLNTEPDL
jgi:peroxiredoxin